MNTRKRKSAQKRAEQNDQLKARELKMEDDILKMLNMAPDEPVSNENVGLQSNQTVQTNNNAPSVDSNAQKKTTPILPAPPKSDNVEVKSSETKKSPVASGANILSVARTGLNSNQQGGTATKKDGGVPMAAVAQRKQPVEIITAPAVNKADSSSEDTSEEEAMSSPPSAVNSSSDEGGVTFPRRLPSTTEEDSTSENEVTDSSDTAQAKPQAPKTSEPGAMRYAARGGRGGVQSLPRSGRGGVSSAQSSTRGVATSVPSSRGGIANSSRGGRGGAAPNASRSPRSGRGNLTNAVSSSRGLGSTPNALGSSRGGTAPPKPAPSTPAKTEAQVPKVKNPTTGASTPKKGGEQAQAKVNQPLKRKATAEEPPKERSASVNGMRAKSCSPAKKSKTSVTTSTPAKASSAVDKHFRNVTPVPKPDSPNCDAIFKNLLEILRNQDEALKAEKKRDRKIDEMEKKLDKVLAQNSQLLIQNKELRDMLAGTNVSGSKPVEPAPEKPAWLPLCSLAELQQLEDDLKNDDADVKKQLMPYLTYLVNSSPDWRDGMKVVLETLLETDLQILIKWEKATEKSKARSLPIEFCYVYTMLMATFWSHVTLSRNLVKGQERSKAKEEADTFLKVWLRGGSDRHRNKLKPEKD